MIFLKVILLLLAYSSRICDSQTETGCTETCQLEIVETIPDGMDPAPNHTSTFNSWKQLIQSATETIEIGSYYWTLRGEEYNHTTADLGHAIYASLLEAGTTRNIEIKIAKSPDETSFPNHDTINLANAGAAEVRDVDFSRWNSSGILHTKLMIVDRKHFYLGSSNFDWRALTQVKEIGIMGTDCPCLAQDVGKAFDVYWYLGQNDTAPPSATSEWEAIYSPENNKEKPMNVSSEGFSYDSYFSVAPPSFCPLNRTKDLDAVYDVIDNAEEFVHIAVMDYFPLIMFDGPLRYWPDLDNKLKSAAIDRKIKVKLLMAKWPNTRSSAEQFLKSLENNNKAYANVDIQVKMFVVPADEDQQNIPYARVNHNKYVVTDKSAYISTSNWSGDYFLSTGGIGLVMTPKNKPSNGKKDIREQVADVFSRDWNSEYAKNLSEIYPNDEVTIPATLPTSTVTPASCM